MTDGADGAGLLSAVQRLRSEVEAATLPLDALDAEPARASRSALLKQLDDYVIPRLTSIDAPLLAVVGGSTGAGKSTLVNSLVGATVSRSGVLRPTTRSPVLVHHVDDERWFVGSRVLPGLARVTGGAGTDSDAAGGAGTGSDAAGGVGTGSDAAGGAGTGSDAGGVRLVASRSLPPGLALLDAPDIDSVVQANRDISRQLLAAADLWLFVTTAARYADAVPWDLLREASERGTSMAIVLDRVPPEAMEEIRGHLAAMLREQGLANAPIFTFAETTLTPEGRLPVQDVARLHSWLSALARDAIARAVVVRRTLTGALDSLRARVTMLATASTGQLAATTALRQAASSAYDTASTSVSAGMSDGTLLRGEVLARWQEFVGTGEFLRHVEAGISRLRDRLTATAKGSPASSSDLGEALQSGVAELVTSQAQGASAAAVRRWRQLAGGAQLVDAHPSLAQPSPDLQARVERLVRDWQSGVLELVRVEGKDRRTTARVLSFGVNGIGVVLMLVIFSHTAGLSGAEIGVAGGSAVLAQRLLEAIFGDQAVRDLAAKARQQLLDKTTELYDAEQARFSAAVGSVEVRPAQAQRLLSAAAAVEAVR